MTEKAQLTLVSLGLLLAIIFIASIVMDAIRLNYSPLAIHSISPGATLEIKSEPLPGDYRILSHKDFVVTDATGKRIVLHGPLYIMDETSIIFVEPTCIKDLAGNENYFGPAGYVVFDPSLCNQEEK